MSDMVQCEEACCSSQSICSFLMFCRTLLGQTGTVASVRHGLDKWTITATLCCIIASADTMHTLLYCVLFLIQCLKFPLLVTISSLVAPIRYSCVQLIQFCGLPTSISKTPLTCLLLPPG
jgi:hypothetical protein